MSIKLNGSSAGSVSFDAPADTSPTGTDVTLTLPTSAGSANQFLKNSGTAGTLEYSSMVEDSSGNVGIGNSSPNALLEINSTTAGNEVQRIEGAYSASGDVTLTNWRRNGGAVTSAIQYHDSLTAMSIGSTTNHAFTFRTNNTERMRIAGNGDIMINTTSFNGTANSISFSVSGYQALRRTSGSAQTMMLFYNGSTLVGEIRTSTTATQYLTSSDYRLKENVAPVTDGITRLQQLKPSRFNFIADPDKTVDGFLAHEVQSIVPEAITGEKDEVDENGDPVYQGIDQSKLVPLLTAALQEAVAKIETLEAQNASLEARLTALEGGAS